MLVQFTVGNYLSFGPDTTWNLRATSDTRLAHHVVTNADGQGGKALGVLRAAALYGANAAGKSNLISALAFAQRLILEGTRGDAAIGVRPFKLGGQGQASRFEFIFRHDKVLYAYGFAVSARRVHEEWLFATPEKREQRLFERTTDEAGKVQVEFGPGLKKSVGAARLGFIAQDTRPNQLLLTELSERNVEAIKPAMQWFKEVILLIGAESRVEQFPVVAHLSKNFKGFVRDFVNVAGTGIADIEVDSIPVDWERDFPGMPDSQREEIQTHLSKIEPRTGYLALDGRGQRFFLMRDAKGDPFRLELFTIHLDSGGRAIRFRLSEESDGTQRLFHLVPALFGLKTEPKVLVIDELDRRLHTLLARLFVQQALDCGDDEPQGQLIFTTHDTNLLDLDLLRRDEIWFVEKDASGATHLASLAEWKVRPDLEIEKGYLNGRFGAIPFFGDVSKLFCREETNGAATNDTVAKSSHNGAAPKAKRAGKNRPSALSTVRN